jgi:hypothetical protein
MKKLLFVLALGAFAACGSGENKDNKDTTVVKVDSPVVAAPDTTVVKAPDTTVVKIDSTAKH